jgi:2-oxoglutarate ferredoxin oxidoreductase subunit delta
MKPVIDLGLCKACNICVYVCPKKCYSKGTDISERGYFAAVVSAPEKCYNHDREGKLICELCVLGCPDQAISWHPESEEEERAR